MFPAAILAGGLATRLRPLTETIPKALLDFHGEPFIAHQLRLLRLKGIEHVVICAGYLGETIRDFVGAGKDFGLRVDFTLDGERLLGTAGAIRKALPLLGDAFFVLYGDSYLLCDYAAVQKAFLESGRKGLMTVFRNEGKWDTSNVEFNHGRIITYDKQRKNPGMRHIDYGLGVFEASAFDQVPPDTPYDLADLYRNLLSAGTLASYEVAERFYEIGSLRGIEELRFFLSADTLTNQDELEAGQ